MSVPVQSAEERLLVLLASENDAKLVASQLARIGIEAHVCSGMPELVAEFNKGAGAILIMEELLQGAANLQAAIEAQPPWSDIPLILLCQAHALPRWAQLRGNTLLIERPLRFKTLESVVEVALRARRRQYQLRDYAVQQAREAEQRRLLWEVGSALLAAGDPASMLRGVFSTIAPSLALDAFLNFMVDETGAALRLLACDGFPADVCASLDRLSFGEGVCGSVAHTSTPLAAKSIQDSDDPRLTLLKSLGFRGYVCHPLLSGGKVMGTLAFASRSKDAFPEDELDFLRMICKDVAVAYDRLRLVTELQEGDRKKDEFLATLAHELRNPLAPLRNSLELLRVAGDLKEVRDDAASMMDRQLLNMVRLVDDLLDVSRITREKLELKQDLVDLRTVLQSAIETSRPLLDSRQHTLTLSMPDRALPVFADVTRLAQVFANLLNNAAKYTEPGGQISLRASVDANRLAVVVEDNGLGIPPEMLNSVFEMFTQVGRAMERTQGGLGIGLTLAKRLVEKHGGTIQAVSEGLEKGSRFTVFLPLAQPAKDTPLGAVCKQNDSEIQRRILVADDNRDSAKSLSALLRTLGHEVHTAYDGAQAVALAAEWKPDVAILDIGMPRLNGYDAARRIREDRGHERITLIALSGWGQDEDKRRSQAAGFNSHLTKPVHLPTLEELLKQSSS